MERPDARTRRDLSLDIVLASLIAGLAGASAALTINYWSELWSLMGDDPLMSSGEVLLFAALEGFMIYGIVALSHGLGRNLSTRITDEGISQLRPLLFRRVRIAWGEVTALREKNGALWIEASEEIALLGGGLSYKDPDGLLAFIEERVPPGTRYIKEDER